MESPRGLKRPPADGRALSLDRSPAPRKDSESWNCQCLSLPTTPCRRALCRTTSNGARRSVSPARPAEVQGNAATVLSLEETREFLPCKLRPPEDTKKDKAQRRVQQGWLKTLLNFLLLRTGPEEPKEKAGRRPKGKEEPTEPLETAEGPAPRKKAHDKKANHKRHSHRKHSPEDTKGAQDLEAGGQEAGLPTLAIALCSEEADLGPALRGGQESDLLQSLPPKEGGAGAMSSFPQATGPLLEEELKKPDEDTVIQMIVELLKKAGDQWEEEQLHAPQLEVTPQNPAPAFRRKPQEKKPSVRRASSLKKPGSEELRRAGTANASSPEARLPRRPSFLPLCVGGHRPSIPSSPGSEEPGVHEALSTDAEGPSPSEPFTQAGCQGPKEELLPDRASESREFMQKILALLHDTEEQKGGQQLQVQKAEVAVENLDPPCRRKSQEKKSSLRRAFSYKKPSSKEPKRMGTVGAVGAASLSPEARPSKRPSFLPLCVSGHRPSVSSSSDAEGLEFQEPSTTGAGPVGFSEAPSQARNRMPEEGPQSEGAGESKELIIHKLVALLQEVDGELGKQIRRHPSFKKFFYEFSDASLMKLVAKLHSQKTCPTAGDRRLTERPSPFAFSLVNKFACNHSRTICSLMGSRGQNSPQGYTQFASSRAQPNIPSLKSQSPD